MVSLHGYRGDETMEPHAFDRGPRQEFSIQDFEAVFARRHETRAKQERTQQSALETFNCPNFVRRRSRELTHPSGSAPLIHSVCIFPSCQAVIVTADLPHKRGRTANGMALHFRCSKCGRMQGIRLD